MAKYTYERISKDKYISKLVAELADEGEHIIKLAYESRGFKNRTKNLKDSYASAVYVDGKLRYNSIRYVGPEEASLADAREDEKVLGHYDGERTRPLYRAAGPDKRYRPGDPVKAYGRDEARRFLNDYKPKEKGIQLVIIAAMFYAGWVERSGYHVLSQSYTDLLALANKYNASVRELDIYRNADKIGVGAFQIK